MANEEEHDPPRGNEWEVVSLTSSAYAAAPSPHIDTRKYDVEYGAASRGLFMSSHFVFPPSEHENLPLEDDEEEEQQQQGKDYEDLILEGQERFHDESALGSLGSESAMYEQHGLINPQGEDLDLLHSDNNIVTTNAVRREKDAKKNLPCEAWWRKKRFAMYSNTRETNAVWSLFFAAAVTGLVVLGQRWQQQERWQILQLKWQSSISSERLSRVFEPLSRLKDVIVRGNPQASFIRSGSSSSEI